MKKMTKRLHFGDFSRWQGKIDFSKNDATIKSKCGSCRFRLKVDRYMFHCAAKFGPHGWAWLWHERDVYRNPGRDCGHYVKGLSKHIGRELKAGEFYKVASERIRSKDWEKWQKEGTKHEKIKTESEA